MSDLKTQIVAKLNLQDIKHEDVKDDKPLCVDGFGWFHSLLSWTSLPELVPRETKAWVYPLCHEGGRADRSYYGVSPAASAVSRH